ncbi:MAG: hypothetical protein ABIT08_09085 [Bacteroidia bacterium]
MKEKDMNRWASETKVMMDETLHTDEQMKQLQNDLHKITAERLFEIFPFLPDGMNADEIRHLGERISRHLYSLTDELKNFAFSVEKEIAEREK